MYPRWWTKELCPVDVGHSETYFRSRETNPKDTKWLNCMCI
jgi:hypothetical protein